MINEEKAKIQEEATFSLEENNFNGIVILPTGTGKTLVLIDCLRRLYQPGMRVLYTCDSQMLRDEGFDEELRKWNAAEYIDRIEKQCYASAYKMQGEEYDILLADEGDYALTPEYSKLFFNNKFRHIIFVSATLDTKKRPLAKKIAPIVYQKKIKEIEEKKVVNKANFFFVPYILNEKENAKYIRYNERFKELIDAVPSPFLDLEQLKKWQDKRQKDLDFLTFNRIHFLASLDSSYYICRKLLGFLYKEDPTSKVLVFCGMTEQADRVCKYSYHEKNVKENNLKKFENNEIQAIAVCGKINRGKNLEAVNKIILENYNQSETLMTQRTGRGRRLHADSLLDVYIPIPYYNKVVGNRIRTFPTVMQEWILKAGRNLGIEQAKTIYLK